MANGIERCYKCRGDVQVFASSGGLGTGDLTSYVAECDCGMKEHELGSDGTRRSAVREYNRIAKSKRIDGDGGGS